MSSRKRVNAAMRLTHRFFRTPLRDKPDANTSARVNRYYNTGQHERDKWRLDSTATL